MHENLKIVCQKRRLDQKIKAFWLQVKPKQLVTSLLLAVLKRGYTLKISLPSLFIPKIGEFNTWSWQTNIDLS